jgi:hypothetical protein
MLVLAITSFSFQANADTRTEEQPSVRVELERYFAEVYAKTCLKNAADMSQLKNKFLEAQVPVLQENKAAFFLGKKQGTVWVIPHVVGDFLVSVDENNHCTVYTHNVNINEVEKLFTKLLEYSTKLYKIERIQDETLATDNGPTHYITYIRTSKKDYSKQKFVLITTTAQGAEIQAKAIVEAVQR